MNNNASNVNNDCRYFTLEEFKELKGFVLVHFNCGKLNDKNRLKIADIKKNLISDSLSVLCLSETWMCDADDSGEFLIPGFNLFRQDRNFNLSKSSGGVSLLIFLRTYQLMIKFILT